VVESVGHAVVCAVFPVAVCWCAHSCAGMGCPLLHAPCTVLQEFLEAMSAYYYGDTPKLSDEEFSLLKDELIWNGSKVRMCVGE